MCWVPSGSSRPRPRASGRPPPRSPACTFATNRGSLAAPGSSAPSPQTARSGGSDASCACSAMCRRATPWSSLTAEVLAASRTSTCSVATSTSRPFGTENGISEWCEDQDCGQPEEAAAPPRSPAGYRLDEERVHGHHHERHPPDARDRGEPHRRLVIDLRDPQRAPAEAAERPRRADPVHHRPQRRETHRREDRASAPDDRRREQPEHDRRGGAEERQRQPCHLSEALDPVERRSVAGQAEREAERSAPAAAGRAEQPQERCDGEERERPPRERRGCGEHEQPARDRDQERDREGRDAPSGAIPAEHPLLVRQLAPVLDQEALLAHELG